MANGSRRTSSAALWLPLLKLFPSSASQTCTSLINEEPTWLYMPSRLLAATTLRLSYVGGSTMARVTNGSSTGQRFSALVDSSLCSSLWSKSHTSGQLEDNQSSFDVNEYANECGRCWSARSFNQVNVTNICIAGRPTTTASQLALSRH